MYDINTVQKFIDLRAKNFTLEKIAEELKISSRTLINWNKKYLKDILFHKQIEIDKLKDKFNISEIQNLEFYSKIIDKCKIVLLEENYKDIPRSDLIRIYNTILNRIQKCDIINVNNVNKFFKTEEEYLDKSENTDS